jgi:transposase
VPRPRSDMRKIREVLRLTFGEGLSRRRVAAASGVPVMTVSGYVRRATAAGLGWPLPEGLDDVALEAALFPPTAPSSVARAQPDFAYAHAELKKKAVTLMLLWVEYREEHPDGYGYSQFCEGYRAWRRKVDVVMRQSHKAGEKLFVDFPGMTVPIYDGQTGEVAMRAELFVAVMGASSYLYAEAFASQELASWMTAHVHTFEFLGGCPAVCVPDNLKAGVTRAHRYEPELNRTFAEMAAHYSVAVIPARPYKPRDKAKAEAGVLLAERWIIARLRHHRFYSLAEANAEIERLVEAINHRPFKKMAASRASLFAEIDRPALKPLPAQRYSYGEWAQKTVNIDYHLEVDHHYYSVPYRLVHERLWTKMSATTVEIFHHSKRVAAHVRSRRRYGHTTDPAHMPESHRRHAQWTPSRILAWAKKTGPSTAALIEGILARRAHPEQGFRSALGIIRLGSRYGEDRLEAAAARALHLGAYSYRSVESILKAGLDRQPLPTVTPSRPHPHHRNVRGATYYR